MLCCLHGLEDLQLKNDIIFSDSPYLSALSAFRARDLVILSSQSSHKSLETLFTVRVLAPEHFRLLEFFQANGALKVFCQFFLDRRCHFSSVEIEDGKTILKYYSFLLNTVVKVFPCKKSIEICTKLFQSKRKKQGKTKTANCSEETAVQVGLRMHWHKKSRFFLSFSFSLFFSGVHMQSSSASKLLS